MPGARELRELCQALSISPNKLLFGTEVPFKNQGFGDLLVDAESENDGVARVRATLLLGMLSSEERNALLTLARSLSIARHGVEKVREAMVAADVMTGIAREFGQITRDGLVKGTKIDNDVAEASAKRLEDFMTRQGHDSDSEKLPKK